MNVVGVDGCRGGWVAMCWDVDRRTVTPGIHETLTALIETYTEAAAIGIDIPIGLSNTGTRACDVAARSVLGRGRASSVFPPPIHDVLHISTFAEAVSLSRQKIEKGISRQAFAIFGKIAEANTSITPAMQNRVFEVHPEVSFWALAGMPMKHRKTRLDGFDERRELLEQATGLSLPVRREAFGWARPAKPDDMLDALVAAWTARRVVDGMAGRLPEVPEMDANGFRMEIVY